MKRIIWVLLVALLLTGCTSQAQPQVNEQNPSLPMPSSGNASDYTDPESGDAVSIRSGDYLDFPEGLPEGVRILPDLINLNYWMTQHNAAEDRMVYTLSWVCEQRMDSVYAFFTEAYGEAEGYECYESAESCMVACVVDGYEMTIMIQPDGDYAAFTMVLSNMPAVG